MVLAPAEVAHRHVAVGRPLDAAAAEDAVGVRINEQREHHLRGKLLVAAALVVDGEGAERHSLDGTDDLVHFIIGAVERVPLCAFAVNDKGCGDEQFPPQMMLALLIYSYANGIFGRRRIERATYRDVSVRYLCGGEHHPDHDTICAFRRKNFEAAAGSFVEVLEMAPEMKLVKPSC